MFKQMPKITAITLLFVFLLTGCGTETDPTKLPPPKTCGDIVFTYTSMTGSEFTGNLHHGYGFKVGVMKKRVYGTEYGDWFAKLGSGENLKAKVNRYTNFYFYDDKGVQIGFMKFYD